MNITEKLRRLTENQNAAGISRKAGLKATQLNDYTSKGFKPRYDIALRIARALGVSVEWLLDDDADWPPPTTNPKPSLVIFSDRELMLEAARRYRREVIRVLETLESAEKIDWEAIKKGVAERPPILELVKYTTPLFFAKELLGLFDPAVSADVNHAEMPGSDRLKSDFYLEHIYKRILELYKREGFVECLVKVLGEIPTADRKEIEDAMRWAGAREAARNLSTKPTIQPPIELPSSAHEKPRNPAKKPPK